MAVENHMSRAISHRREGVGLPASCIQSQLPRDPPQRVWSGQHRQNMPAGRQKTFVGVGISDRRSGQAIDPQLNDHIVAQVWYSPYDQTSSAINRLLKTWARRYAAM